MVNSDPFVVIDKTWLFELLEVHFAPSKGIVLTDIRNQIRDLDRAPPTELGKGYRTPGCLSGWFLGKNDVLIEDGQCLTDSALIKAHRASNVANTYQFRGEIIRQAATMEFAGRLEREEQDLEFHEDFSAYLRTIARKLQRVYNGSIRGGGLQIHMIIHGGSRRKDITTTKKRNDSVRHFRDAVGIIRGG